MINRLGKPMLLVLILGWALPFRAQAEPHRPHHGAPSVRLAFPPPHHPPLQHTHAMPAYSRPMTTIPAPARYPTTVIRPTVATYVARPPLAIAPAPRVVAVPTPYFVIVGSGYTGNNLAYPAEPNWNWTPVESVTALAGRSDLRYFCPDTRSYYPETEACPSPWLKVVP